MTAAASAAGIAASRPAGGLRVVRERHQLRRDTRTHDQRRRREPPVVPGTAGLDARPCQVQRPIQRRQRGGLEDEPRPGRPGHLQPVAQQPEPRHVGRAADSVAHQDLGRGAVEGTHLLDGRLEVGIGRLP